LVGRAPDEKAASSRRTPKWALAVRLFSYLLSSVACLLVEEGTDGHRPPRQFLVEV
jgi:hypothetical protein